MAGGCKVPVRKYMTFLSVATLIIGEAEADLEWQQAFELLRRVR